MSDLPKMTCAVCRERLLEYVYGLLMEDDPQEATLHQAISAHLVECDGCRADHQRALAHQRLLGQASKIPTQLRFAPPVVEPFAPLPTPPPPTSAPNRYATPWFILVASWLLLALGISAGTAWWGAEHFQKPFELAQDNLRHVSGDLDAILAKPSDADAKLTSLRNEVHDAEVAWAAKESEALDRARAQTNYLQVAVPPAVERGNTTSLLVTQKRLDEKPQPLDKVQVQFKGEAQSPLAAGQAQSDSAMQYSLALSAPPGREELISLAVRSDTTGYIPSSSISSQLQALNTTYVAQLVADKPLYQPGETVNFRLLVLEKATFRPIRETLTVKCALSDPDGKIIATQSGPTLVRQAEKSDVLVRDILGKPVQGVAASSFAIPETALSGDYTLTVTDSQDRFPAQSLNLLVNRPIPPHLNKDSLRFNKLSYAPGERVELSGAISMAASKQPWAAGKVSASVLIDGKYYDAQGKPTHQSYPITAVTDALGSVKISFQLPAQIERGQIFFSLKLESEDAEKTEVWSHSLHLSSLQPVVELYPEGGDLIAGVPNHVYFQIRNPRGEPMDGAGRLLDETGQQVASWSTFRDDSKTGSARGMGSLEFTPRVNQHYRVQFTQPPIPPFPARLAAAKPEGVTLHMSQPILQPQESLNVRIANVGPPRDLILAAYCRGQLVAMQSVILSSNQTQEVDWPLAGDLGGVYRVTAFERVMGTQNWQARPVAERLIYRHPRQRLNLSLAAQPRGENQFNLAIQAKTEELKSSTAYVTVVGLNQALLSMANDKTARQLPAHFLLAQEIREPEELEHADFLLSDHPSARRALDLLLGVQGWRRFKEASPQVADVGNRSWNEVKPVILDNRQEVLAAVEERIRKELPQKEPELHQRWQKAKQALAQSTQLEQDQQQQRQQQLSDAQQKQKSAAQMALSSQQNWHDFQGHRHTAMMWLWGSLSIGAFVLLMARRKSSNRLFLGLLLLTFSFACVMTSYFALSPGKIEIASTTSLNNRTENNAAPRGRDILPTPSDLSDKKTATISPPASVAATPAPLSGAEKTPSAPFGGGGGGVDSRGGALAAAPAPPTARGGIDPAKAELNKSMPNMERPMAPPAASRPAAPALEGKSATRVIPEYRANAKVSADSKAKSIAPVPTTPEVTTAARQSTANAISNRQAELGQQVQKNWMLQQAPQRRTAGGASQAPAGHTGSTAAGKTEPAAREESQKDSLKLGFSQAKERAQARDLKDAPGKSKAHTTESDEIKAQERDATNRVPFYVREYSWNKDKIPDVLQTSAWSQTVYWNPLLVIPRGEVSLPLSLPSEPGVYQFAVFGHGGDGRLGAATLLVKSPTDHKPLAFRVLPSTSQARVGDPIQLELELKNTTTLRQSRVITIIQFPEGVALPPNFRIKKPRPAAGDQDQEPAVESTTWNASRRELTVIWNELAAHQTVKLSLPALCQRAGQFSGKARAHLENQEQISTEAPPWSVTIAK